MICVMDTIHIRTLIVSGNHGAYEEERRLEQEFQVDLEFSCDTSKAGVSDALKDTVDYQVIKDIIVSIIKNTKTYLIEKIAEDIARAILGDPRITSVTVSVQKITIWKNGIPGVTITRSR